jgi:hypothetical protein
VGARRYVPGGGGARKRRCTHDAAGRARRRACGAGSRRRGRDGDNRSRSRARRRVAAGQLRRALRRAPTLRRALMRSANAATVRLGETAGSGGRGPGSPRGHPEPARRGAPLRWRRRGHAAGAGHRVRPVRQRWRSVTPAGAPHRGGRRHGALARPARKAERVLGEAEAFQPSMLESVVDGHGRAPAISAVRGGRGQDRQHQRRHQRVFVGYTPTVVAAVWVRRAETDRAVGLGRPARGACVGGVLPGRLVRAEPADWPARRPREPHDRLVQRGPRERVVPRHQREIMPGPSPPMSAPEAQGAVRRSAGGVRPEDRGGR